jgi:hypothetical protein
MTNFESWHSQCLSLAEIAAQMERGKFSVRTRALKMNIAIARDRNSMQSLRSHPLACRDRAEGEGMMPANHRERQLMQHLRSGAWVKAIMLPPSAKLNANLLDKGWIEHEASGPSCPIGSLKRALLQRRRPFEFIAEHRLVELG